MSVLYQNEQYLPEKCAMREKIPLVQFQEAEVNLTFHFRRWNLHRKRFPNTLTLKKY